MAQTEDQKANVKKWVAALRSGEYDQAVGGLYQEGGGYCCLGVACLVAEQSGVNVDSGTELGWRSLGTLNGVPLVVNWLGIRGAEGGYEMADRERHYLTSDNDGGKTFMEIADIIEHNPKGLFV